MGMRVCVYSIRFGHMLREQEHVYLLGRGQYGTGGCSGAAQYEYECDMIHCILSLWYDAPPFNRQFLYFSANAR